MKVMLEEIARKKAEEDQMRAEELQAPRGVERALELNQGCVTVRASTLTNRIW